MRRLSRTTIVVITLVSAVAAFGAIAMLVNIFERKQEGRNPFYRVAELTDETEDPAVWGRNFPLQYDGYRRTVDQERTRYGGSEALPRTPTAVDPRTVIAQSRLEEDPRLKILWAGYAFAKDFREERGHAYMLDDQVFTERQQVTKQPGTCIHCHASVYVPYKRAGGGDLIKGFEAMNHLPYAEARKQVTHPVTCIDCHDPATLQLRVTRPGFLEGIRALKASQGVQNYDPNRDATRQEMRAFVCGQCHVEYYFKGPDKRLVYPWAKGIKIENILDYYEEVQHNDWTHADTGAGVLKAQHPGVRDVEPGHPRAVGRRLRRLPHALHARRRDEDLRPPRPQPGAQHQPRVPDVPPLARSRTEGARGNDPGPRLFVAQPRDGCRRRSDRGPQGGEGRRAQRRRSRRGAARCSGARSSCWISSRPRTPPASTLPRRPAGSSPSRSTTRARGSWR